MSGERTQALLSRLYREATAIPDKGTRNRILNLTDRVRTEIRKQQNRKVYEQLRRKD